MPEENPECRPVGKIWGRTGLGALVGVDFYFKDEKKNNCDDWRNKRVHHSPSQSPHCGFFLSWRTKKNQKEMIGG